MGIKGLWALLEPACEKLPSQDRLRDHRLAIDASIWMYQLTKVLPSDQKSVKPGAGYNPLVLAGLLRRVCKLLHFGIKPVFVFDGGVPILKAATVKERRGRRAEAESRYKRLAKKMLRIRMSMAALGPEDSKQNSLDAPKDEEEIAPEEIYSSSESELDDFDDEQLDGLDIDSADFKSLPLDLRQELLLALKERLFRDQLAAHYPATTLSSPADALSFSQAQIASLVKRRRIAGELEKASWSAFGSYGARRTVEGYAGHRIAASSTREFILVKGDAGGWTFQDKQEAKAEADECKQVEVDENDFEAQFFAADDDDAVVVPTPAPPSILHSDSQKIEAVRPAPLREKPNFSSKAPVIVPPIPEETYSSSSPSIEPEAYGDDENEEDEELVMPSLELIIEQRQAPIRVSPLDRADLSSTEEEEEVPIEPYFNQIPVEMTQPQTFKHEQFDEDAFLEEYQHTTREELLQRLDQSLAEAQEGMRAAQNESCRLDDELLTDFQQLLNLFGLPWVVAPMEAEAQCAWLQSAGLVDGIITDDSDVLLFCPPETPLLVYRHFFKDRHPVRVYSMARVELQSGTKRRDLIVLAFLLGGDYGVGVRGIGGKRGAELLRLLKRAESVRGLEGEAEYCTGLLSLLARLASDFDGEIGAELELPDQTALERITRHIHYLDPDFPISSKSYANTDFISSKSS